jgi:hypothetical protein
VTGSTAFEQTKSRQPAYSNSNKGGKSVLIWKKDLWKNNLNFVMDVPTIYVNFITTVITDCEEKKIRGITFVPSLVQ